MSFAQTGDMTTTSNTYGEWYLFENSSLCKGETYHYNFHTKNIGSGTDEFTGKVGLFFSRDSIYDVGDSLVLSYDYANLAANDYANKTGYLTMYGDTGVWYLILFTDYEELNTEANENNNTVIHKVTLNPRQADLNFANSSIISTINELVGTTARYWSNLRIYNDGCSSGGSTWNVSIYHSDDSILSSDDFLSESYDWQLSAISPGTSGQIVTTTQYKGGGVPHGTSYLIMVVDADSVVTEFNEENNYKIYKINGVYDSVDYVMNEVILDSVNYSESDSLVCTLNWTRRINNTNQYSNTDIAIYLSIDSIWDANDLLIDRASNVSNGPLDSVSTVGFSTLVPNVQAGTYYLLGVVDYLEDDLEENELNNFAGVKINIANKCGSEIFLTEGFTSVCEGYKTQVANNTQANNHNIYFGDTLFYYLSSSPTFSSEFIIDTLSSSNDVLNRRGSFTADFSIYPDTIFTFAVTGKMDSLGVFDTASSCYRRTSGPTFVASKKVDLLDDVTYYCTGDTAFLHVDIDPSWTDVKWRDGSYYYVDTLVVTSNKFVYHHYTDSNGCSFQDRTNVRSTSPYIYANASPSNCGPNTGAVNVKINEGDSIFWNSHSRFDYVSDSTSFIIGLDTGNYSFLVKDTIGCTKTDEVTVVSDSFYVDILFTGALTCFGGEEADFQANGKGNSSGLTYIWNDSISGQYQYNQPAGTYVVKAEDNKGCIAYDTLVVSQPDADTVYIDTTIMLGSIYEKWGESYTETGIYIDTLVREGCDSVAKITVTVDITTNTNFIGFSEFDIYPNPVENSLYLSISNFGGKSEFIRIYSVTGELVKADILKSSTTIIDLSNLQEGVYFVSVNGYNQAIVKR